MRARLLSLPRGPTWYVPWSFALHTSHKFDGRFSLVARYAPVVARSRGYRASIITRIQGHRRTLIMLLAKTHLQLCHGMKKRVRHVSGLFSLFRLQPAHCGFDLGPEVAQMPHITPLAIFYNRVLAYCPKA